MLQMPPNLDLSQEMQVVSVDPVNPNHRCTYATVEVHGARYHVRYMIQNGAPAFSPGDWLIVVQRGIIVARLNAQLEQEDARYRLFEWQALS